MPTIQTRLIHMLTRRQSFNSESDLIMQYLLTLTPSERTCQWVCEGSHVCGAVLPADPKLVSVHFRNAHGLRGDSKERITCAWLDCSSHPLQWRNMTRHILSVHLELLKWTCPVCLKTLSRRGTGHYCSPSGGNIGETSLQP